MRRPRFTIRTLMILIAILAPLLVGITWAIRVALAVEAFYGPGGDLERIRKGANGRP